MSQNARELGSRNTGASGQKGRETPHGFKPLALPALAAAARKGVVSQRKPAQQGRTIRHEDSDDA